MLPIGNNNGQSMLGQSQATDVARIRPEQSWASSHLDDCSALLPLHQERAYALEKKGLKELG